MSHDTEILIRTVGVFIYKQLRIIVQNVIKMFSIHELLSIFINLFAYLEVVSNDIIVTDISYLILLDHKMFVTL